MTLVLGVMFVAGLGEKRADVNETGLIVPAVGIIFPLTFSPVAFEGSLHAPAHPYLLDRCRGGVDGS